MAIFRCKSCGGDLEVKDGVSVVECEYCGNKQTLPKVTDENLQSLFNRANFFRQKCEFDKAEKLYEKILEEDEREAEAYWGIILCKFGIEYVNDPATDRRIPTCHRASYESVVADDNYKQALKYADAIQRPVYEADAKAIDEIQKKILEISNKEQPYDVFICYKETDENGQRTHDSVMANDIYYQLTQEGYKVFYAAITLEGKLGSDYEAIIFAALNSAKVMLVVGSKPEYFQATWVRNEWSRYLQIMKKDRGRLLIPCYSGMDAYNLPEEFAHLQAQDMSKIGFINDLVRGIKKVIPKGEPKAAAPAKESSDDVAPLLKRAFICLEDGEFSLADEFCEKVLDKDPENAMAYLGKLMVEYELNEISELEELDSPFDNELNYKKAYRYADDALKAQLKGYNDAIRKRIEMESLEERYAKADALAKQGASDYTNYKRAHDAFMAIKDFKDSEARATECLNKIYAYANKLASDNSDNADKLTEAAGVFRGISDYRDSEARAEECLENAKLASYNKACNLMNSSNVSDIKNAVKTFKSIPGYKDSDALLKKAQQHLDSAVTERSYQLAVSAMNNAKSVSDYESAMESFRALGNYKDSWQKYDDCLSLKRKLQNDIERANKRAKLRERRGCIMGVVIVLAIIIAIVSYIVIYVVNETSAQKDAESLIAAGQYEEAIERLDGKDDSDSRALIGRAKYGIILKALTDGNMEEAEKLWEEHQSSFSVSDERKNDYQYHRAAAYANAGDYAKAKEIYDSISEYSDVKTKVEKLADDALVKLESLVAEKKYGEAYAIAKAFNYPEEKLPAETVNILRCLAEENYAGAVKAGLTDIELPEGMTEIPVRMFEYCEGLTSIKIPSTVTTIGAGAFIGCTSLKSVTVPAGVTVLSDSVFEGCTALTEVIIPNTVTEIQLEAFRECTSLAKITIPDSVTVIGNGAFYGCTALADIKLPSNLTTLGASTFYACKALTEIVLPDSLESVGDDAFRNCENLASITLPFVGEKADGTGSRSFYYIFEGVPASLKSVTVTKDTVIADSAFKDCKSIESITLPDTVTSIGSSAFRGCKSLRSLKIPASVTEIQSYTFYDCLALSSVEMSAQIRTIGARAFENCYSLLSIKIPASVTGIAEEAFADCVKLVEVYNLSSMTMAVGTDTHGKIAKNAKVINTSDATASILTKQGDFVFLEDGDALSLIAYTGKDTVLTLPTLADSKTYGIANYAFYYGTSITQVTIPAGVTSIGAEAFYGCSAITSVDMSASAVTFIGDHAFRFCSELASVKLSSSLNRIGIYAFADTKLASAEFGTVEGWWYTSNAEAVSGTAIDESSLTNSITAANLLKSGRASYYWRRSE